MLKEIVNAEDVQVPREVIVHPRSGRPMYRVVITAQNLDESQPGYRRNALGIDPVTGQKLSLAPSTRVELGRPVDFG